MNQTTRLIELAAAIGLTVPQIAAERFERFTGLLLSYNQKVNLTAITDPAEITIRHYLDSISPLAFDLIPNAARVIDVGCGAGFPSFPLAFLREDCDFTLLDSLRKRITFIETVTADLQLTNITPIHGRAEELGQDLAHREQYDIAVSRAVSRLNRLCEVTLPFVAVGGCLIAYKAVDSDEEITEAANALEVLGATLEEVKDIALCEGLTHRLVVIRKNRETPTKYPRKPAKISASPL